MIFDEGFILGVAVGMLSVGFACWRNVSLANRNSLAARQERLKVWFLYENTLASKKRYQGSAEIMADWFVNARNGNFGWWVMVRDKKTGRFRKCHFPDNVLEAVQMVAPDNGEEA